MKIKKLYIFIFLNSFLVLAQEKDGVIKIYLENAYNGKEIIDAKVTLGGFELPEIIGTYDKKEKYYYFTEIPKGYNTIMAYHENYNSKGFQSLAGLPKKVVLKLFTPYRIKLENSYYKEDDKKLIIEFKEDLLKIKKTCIQKGFEDYIDNHFPELEIIHSDRFPNAIANSILVKKRNTISFKRFNDTTIKKLEKDKNILAVYGLMLKTADAERTYFLEDGTPTFLSKYEKYIDADYAIELYKNWDKSHFTQKQNIRYDRLKEYYNFLTKNGITSLPIEINDNRKDSLYNNYLQEDFYKFSTHKKDDTLLVSNNKIYLDLTKNRAFSYLENMDLANSTDTFDPYIIMSASINNRNTVVHFADSAFNLFLKRHRKIIKKDTYKNKNIYRFEGSVSPFGALDLLDYYKNKENFNL